MRQLLVAVSVAVAAAIVAAQDAASPAFEVATIKINKSGENNQLIRRQPGGRVTVTNMPARFLIMFAYQLAQYQLIGGPSWLNTDRFDMVAKLEGNPEFPPLGQGADPIQLAMRALMTDRFKLKLHRET